MQKGNGDVPVTPGASVSIRTDGEFTVYGYAGNNLEALLGPPRSGERFLRFKVPPTVNRLHIKAKPSVRWATTETVVNGQEHPDPTPLALPVGYEHPESLQESMHRFIREEVGRQYAAKMEAGSFEEEDDFDVPDDIDDEALLSPYEVTEMQEEELAMEPPPTTSTKEPSASCPAASAEDSDQPVPAENEPAEPVNPS